MAAFGRLDVAYLNAGVLAAGPILETDLATWERVMAVNLRGMVIPVADLRLKFGMDACQATDQTVIIVVQCAVAGRNLTMGILVDQVLEVLSIEPAQIEPPPALGETAVEAQFIMGVGKAGERVVFLLDIGKVLGGDGAYA